jgi:formylglycine-generating enzyme required for sulfatase activity
MPGLRNDQSGGTADDRNDETEDARVTPPEAERWPGDDRLVVRVTPVLKMDLKPVTCADYARFVEATGYKAPRPDGAPQSELRDAPVVHVDIEDARAYARWAKKRLPIEHEWVDGLLRIGAEAASVGITWEWTASRHRTGHVVRGGPYRDRPGTKGAATNRSWEDSASRDVGFRCVVDG